MIMDWSKHPLKDLANASRKSETQGEHIETSLSPMRERAYYRMAIIGVLDEIILVGGELKESDRRIISTHRVRCSSVVIAKSLYISIAVVGGGRSPPPLYITELITQK